MEYNFVKYLDINHMEEMDTVSHFAYTQCTFSALKLKAIGFLLSHNSILI